MLSALTVVLSIKGAFSNYGLGQIDELSDIGSYLQFNEYRTHDGSGNNLLDTDMGSSCSRVHRCVPSDYADGYNSMSGAYRYNPREISNVIGTQMPEEDPKYINSRHLTQFAWQWGQFLDHDVTLISEDHSTWDEDLAMSIYIPCADPTFDPECSCNASIIMETFRSVAFNDSGSDKSNPRYQKNDITSWVDASMIYGSSDETADELRFVCYF